jgi:hypothetical protein
MFVLHNKETGVFASARGWRARHSKGTTNLQQARVFKRRCDAANAQNSGGPFEVVEVVLSLKGE